MFAALLNTLQCPRWEISSLDISIWLDQFNVKSSRKRYWWEWKSQQAVIQACTKFGIGSKNRQLTRFCTHTKKEASNCFPQRTWRLVCYKLTSAVKNMFKCHLQNYQQDDTYKIQVIKLTSTHHGAQFGNQFGLYLLEVSKLVFMPSQPLQLYQGKPVGKWAKCMKAETKLLPVWVFQSNRRLCHLVLINIFSYSHVGTVWFPQQIQTSVNTWQLMTYT